MPRHDPKKSFFIIAGVLVVGLLVLLTSWLKWDWRIAALISVNAITLLFYGLDKRFSRKNAGRIPELVLHLLATLGGSPAAFAGQRVFHHKTRKQQFLLIFWLIVLLQVSALLVWFVRGQNGTAS